MSGLERVAKARAIAEAALDLKAEELVALDARGVASFADTFVIASGRSDRQVRAIADAILERLALEGERAIGVEGYEEGRWVLLDFGDAVVHVFLPDVRAHYDLERLWADAAPLDVARPGHRSAAP
jgi:ribosome-associated protein